METRLRHDQKKSKQAKADRIVNSLKMKAAMLSPVTKKIKKKRRTRPPPATYLPFETQTGRKRRVCFIFSKTSRKNSFPKTLPPKPVDPAPVPLGVSLNNSQGGGYGDIFASVYENLKKKSESNPKNGGHVSTEDKSRGDAGGSRRGDDFVGIEYEPGDNYFYLVGRDPRRKMALFENQGMKGGKQGVRDFVVNQGLLRSLKQDFQLEELFQ
jgi:hypothetical protein